MEQSPQYVIEMLHITKEFPGIKANDDITLQLRKGEIHALLGENGAGKSTLMSVLFGLYQPEEGEIRKNGKPVKINDPNDATALGIGMVHQHFKLIDVFTVLDNIILGAEDTKMGFLQKKAARQKVQDLSQRYGLRVDLDARIEDITVGMQQRVEILKMLYRDNEILIFDEPTAVLTPQEIDELMEIMRSLTKEGKSILFISHKLNEIMAVADRCTVFLLLLRRGAADRRDGRYFEQHPELYGCDPGALFVRQGRPDDPAQGAGLCAWLLRCSDCHAGQPRQRQRKGNGVHADRLRNLCIGRAVEQGRDPVCRQLFGLCAEPRRRRSGAGCDGLCHGRRPPPRERRRYPSAAVFGVYLRCGVCDLGAADELSLIHI